MGRAATAAQEKVSLALSLTVPSSRVDVAVSYEPGEAPPDGGKGGLGCTSIPDSKPRMVAGAPAPMTNAGQPPLILRMRSSRDQGTQNEAAADDEKARAEFTSFHGHLKPAAVTAVISASSPAASPPAKPQLAACIQLIG